MAFWPRGSDCDCCRNGVSCIHRGSICAPRGDDTRIIFSVFDNDGDEFDIMGASEIVFIVADGEVVGGNVYPGGAVLIEKRLTTGGVSLAGSGYEFVVDVDAADTAALNQTRLYYEAQVTTSAGLKKTVSAGIFRAENTMIRNI